MEIRNRFPDYRQEFGFDCGWKRFVLALRETEFACYSLFDVTRESRLVLHLFVKREVRMVVFQGDRRIWSGTLPASEARQEIGPLALDEAEKSVIRVEVSGGEAELEEIVTAR